VNKAHEIFINILIPVYKSINLYYIIYFTGTPTSFFATLTTV